MATNTPESTDINTVRSALVAIAAAHHGGGEHNVKIYQLADDAIRAFNNLTKLKAVAPT